MEEEERTRFISDQNYNYIFVSLSWFELWQVTTTSYFFVYLCSLSRLEEQSSNTIQYTNPLLEFENTYLPYTGIHPIQILTAQLAIQEFM